MRCNLANSTCGTLTGDPGHICEQGSVLAPDRRRSILICHVHVLLPLLGCVGMSGAAPEVAVKVADRLGPDGQH
jgi:hypothetical protein